MIPVTLFIEICHKFRDWIPVIAHSSCQRRKVWRKQTVKKEKENSNENTSSNTFLEEYILQVSLFYSKNINRMPFDERGSSRSLQNILQTFLAMTSFTWDRRCFLESVYSEDHWQVFSLLHLLSFLEHRSEQTKRCRDDCLCEQKYKWHRLLAYDPDDDCHGIFMDWFLFPSSCACRCTDPLLGG